MAWEPKGNLRGPAGYNATGAVEDIQTMADYAKGTAGPNALTEVLDTTYANKVDLVAKLRGPVYVAHRGGGYRYPEASMEAFRAAATDGFPLEMDLQALADGTLVCLHDDTTGRTMTGPDVAPSTLTREQWLSRRIKPPVGGSKSAVPPLWDDILNEFGGRAVLIPEPKGNDQALALAVMDSLQERGLERASIFSSFNQGFVLDAMSRGFYGLWFNNVPVVADLVSAGMEFHGLSEAAATPALLADLTAAGIKPLVYTLNSVASVGTALANGAWGIITDEPKGLSGQYATQTVDPYREMVPWPRSGGLIGTSSGFVSFKPMSAGQVALHMVPGAQPNEQGWAGQLPGSNFTIEFDMQIGAIGTVGSASVRVMLSQNLTRPHSETAEHPDWLMYMIRRGGSATTYKATDGGGSTLMTNTVTANSFTPTLAASTAGEWQRYRLNIAADGTSTFSNLTFDKHVIDGPEKTLPDLTTPWWLSIGISNTSALFKDFVISTP